MAGKRLYAAIKVFPSQRSRRRNVLDPERLLHQGKDIYQLHLQP